MHVKYDKNMCVNCIKIKRNSWAMKNQKIMNNVICSKKFKEVGIDNN